MTGSSTRCLNLGSYNYLGFAETSGPCADAAIESVYKYGVGNCSPRRELGEFLLPSLPYTPMALLHM